MDYNKLAELLFPNVTDTCEDIENKYPPRNLPEGAKVTRFAPSPTGFIHLGGIYGAMIDERLAHQSGGIFYLRIEDTDAKREVPGAAVELIKTLAEYGMEFDEGAAISPDGEICDKGIYGPFKQSERAHIYHVYAKKLVSEGKAYPVFTTQEELDELNATDKKAEVKSKVWTEEAANAQREEMLKQREFTIDEVEAHLKAGDPFVLRILSEGDGEKKTKVGDLVRGALELPENDEDFVLLKSDGIPTYHFAHAIDDHLMGTTHVIRGEEWLPSLPKHLQLFKYLGFKMPKYLHTAQIMKLDENGNKKKLSKRDMGLDMKDYKRGGYLPECVCEYIMTILNSNYDEWRMQNPEKSYKEFPFSFKKMSNSGCLLDFAKLTDVSKNVISRLTADEVYAKLLPWAEEYDPEFAAVLSADKEKAIRILSIGRGGKKPRKDLATFADAKPYMSLFYNEYFAVIDAYPEKFDNQTVRSAIEGFLQTFDFSDDMNTWFDKIKALADSMGFASDMKAYKAQPDSFKGNVADISSFIRVAVTGKLSSPDMYEVMQVLGKDTVVARINSEIARLS
ncbi:MAG: glutamate--tRNA ligase [Clostridia bacterium]|nr:glutamate--tRNA ligase [Clostridia bacterium]